MEECILKELQALISQAMFQTASNMEEEKRITYEKIRQIRNAYNITELEYEGILDEIDEDEVCNTTLCT